MRGAPGVTRRRPFGRMEGLIGRFVKSLGKKDGNRIKKPGYVTCEDEVEVQGYWLYRREPNKVYKRGSQDWL